MPKSVRALTCSILLFFSALANAKPVEIRVVTAAWLGYADTRGEGYYFEILKRAFPAPEWELKITVVPFARSIQLLTHERADVVLGVYQGDLRRGSYSQYAVELDQVDIALTPAMARDWKGLESLALRKVQAYLAYGFDRIIPHTMYYEESSSLVDMLDRLNEGRIDAVLDYRPGLEAATRRLGKPVNYVIMDNVLSAEVYFGFADTRFGASLKVHFDEAHKQMINDGIQDQLFRQTQQALGLED